MHVTLAQTQVSPVPGDSTPLSATCEATASPSGPRSLLPPLAFDFAAPLPGTLHSQAFDCRPPLCRGPTPAVPHPSACFLPSTCLCLEAAWLDVGAFVDWLSPPQTALHSCRELVPSSPLRSPAPGLEHVLKDLLFLPSVLTVIEQARQTTGHGPNPAHHLFL